MDAMDDVNGSLDRQFDKLLVEMKPYVMKLPHQSGKTKQIKNIPSVKFCLKSF